MILLYHLVFPDATPKDAWNAGNIIRLSAFKRQLRWLKQRFKILPLDAYMAAFHQNPGDLKGKFSLTFDDGYQQVYDLVVPFLIEESIPATFFATTSHLEDGELLWFVYFNALCSERCYQVIDIQGKTVPLTDKKSSLIAWQKLIDLARESGQPIDFARGYAQKYPLPPDITQKYAGFTADQIRQIGEIVLLDVGGHTHQHPYLDQIPKEEQIREIQHNKQVLERLTYQPVRHFAYTGGLYNGNTIDTVRKLGFQAAFAVHPKNIGGEMAYEMPRVDIYSPSLLKFKLKASGLSEFLRRFGFWNKAT
jgi:peptidoglycan/xylan/chitin deacetylase (PgdA/CDA1 family)